MVHCACMHVDVPDAPVRPREAVSVTPHEPASYPECVHSHPPASTSESAAADEAYEWVKLRLRRRGCRPSLVLVGSSAAASKPRRCSSARSWRSGGGSRASAAPGWRGAARWKKGSRAASSSVRGSVAPAGGRKRCCSARGWVRGGRRAANLCMCMCMLHVACTPCDWGWGGACVYSHVRACACVCDAARACRVCERAVCVCLAASVRNRQWWRRAVQAVEGHGAGRINSPAGHFTQAIDSDRPTGFTHA